MSITLTGTAAINYLQAENAKLTAKVAELTAKVAEQDQWKNTILSEDYKLEGICYQGVEYGISKDGIVYNENLDAIGKWGFSIITFQGVEYNIKDGIVFNEDLEAIGNWEFSIITFISEEARCAHESHESYEQPEQPEQPE
jgi:hypothetical protein